MNTRIRLLRKELKMTTEVFGEKLGIVSSAVSNIEAGRRQPTNQLILSICREFNVNEQWLRTGEGEMFNDLSREQEIIKFVTSLMTDSDDDIRKSTILAMSQLTDEQWAAWAAFIDKLYESYRPRNKSEPK